MTIETIHNDIAIDPIAYAGLQRRMRGQLLLPEMSEYEAARLLPNLRFDRHPALIARVYTSQDVAAAVLFAREHGLEVAVRSGGHSLAGYSVNANGLMIDFSRMRAIDIDPVQRTARVQMGVTNGELVLAAQVHGLATTTGTCATDGIVSEGERLLAPLRRFGPPAVDLIAQRQYADLYMMLTPPIPPGAAWHDTAYTLQKPSGDAIDMLVASAAEMPLPFSAINIHQVHGTATRISADTTAFALREPHYSVVNIGMWMKGASTGADETFWSWRARSMMLPFASRGIYSNFLGEEGEEAARVSYRANYARLTAVKAAYDPENIFHRNQNIRPVK